MQHDEVIWQVIRHHHCSFMAKIETGIFCRNPYNVTGICNRSSCPLANSRYATIRDHDGVFYLYLKTIERAHMPDKLWERVKLPRNYEKALEIIDKHMIYWPKLLVHKIKQRLTKMTQVRIRMRKLALKIRERIMTDPTKTRKQEALREEKALKAARLEDSISKELLERHENRVYPIEEYYKILSKEGTKENIHEIEKIIEKEVLERLTKGGDGDIVNYPVKEYNKILDKEAIMDYIDESEDEGEPENKYVEGYEDLEEAEDIEDFGGLAMMDDDDVGMDDDDDEEIVAVQHKRWGKNSARNPEKEEPGAKSKKKAKVLVEVEREGTGERQRAVL